MHPGLQKAVEFFSELPKRPSTVLNVTRTPTIDRMGYYGNTYHVSFLRNVITLPRKISRLCISIEGGTLNMTSYPGEEVDLVSDQIELKIDIGCSPDGPRAITDPQKRLETLVDETINILLSPEYIPVDPREICERIIQVIKQVDEYQVNKK